MGTKSARNKTAKLARPAARTRRICRCGLCKACADNARWERVYNEKFADVTYYSGLQLSNRSPLADL